MLHRYVFPPSVSAHAPTSSYLSRISMISAPNTNSTDPTIRAKVPIIVNVIIPPRSPKSGRQVLKSC